MNGFLFSPFRLDVANEQLWRDECLIALRPKTFAVLRYLVEHPGRLVTKEELLRAVWGETLVSEDGLRDYLREIRQALRDDPTAPRFVETVQGRGYRFIAPLSTPPRSSLASSVPRLASESQNRTFPRVQTLDPRPHTLDVPLVGRDADLARLQGWLEKALNGERQLVFVTGEPGIGKTALLETLVSRVQRLESEEQRHMGTDQTLDPRPQTLDSGVWLGWGQCIEQHGAGEAFLPILDAVGKLCRGPEGERIIDVLRRHAPMWLVQLPAFIEGEELEALQHKVQGASRERMLREIAEALEVLTVEQPLILVLEDLHWSDVSTLDLLAFVARRKEPACLLVIGTYRPVEMLGDGHPLKLVMQELYAHGWAMELALGLLSEADIRAYLKMRFEGKPSRDREGAERPPLADARGSGSNHVLVRTLYRRTGGNPLFLVSTVDDLVARGLFMQTDEGWTFQDEIEDVGIADSIRHLVARQSERLSPEEQHTLEAASVAGMEFSAAAVASALATDTATVEQHCQHLTERQQFLKRLGVEEWPDGTLAARYTFLHALYQQLWHERVSPS